MNQIEIDGFKWTNRRKAVKWTLIWCALFPIVLGFAYFLSVPIPNEVALGFIWGWIIISITTILGYIFGVTIENINIHKVLEVLNKDVAS